MKLWFVLLTACGPLHGAAVWTICYLARQAIDDGQQTRAAVAWARLVKARRDSTGRHGWPLDYPGRPVSVAALQAQALSNNQPVRLVWPGEESIPILYYQDWPTGEVPPITGS